LVILWRRCVKLCTSGFANDVMFSDNTWTRVASCIPKPQDDINSGNYTASNSKKCCCRDSSLRNRPTQYTWRAMELIVRKYDVIHQTGSSCSIATPRRTNFEPRPPPTCIENLARFGHVAFEICVQTYRQTDRQTDTLIISVQTKTAGVTRTVERCHVTTAGQ